MDLFAEGEVSSRRNWSGEQALEWLSQTSNHRFSYALLQAFLASRAGSIGKAMIAARRRAAEPGGWPSTRRRWTAWEDEVMREQLALDVPDRGEASICCASQQTGGGGGS